MQLVAYGAQDVYLTGKPEITFFKAVYKRHTNFATEAITQVFSGTADFGKRVGCPIARNGDLISKMYLTCTLSDPDTARAAGKEWGYVSNLGHALINSVELEIGGSKIDKQYGHWMNVWHNLTQRTGHYNGYSKMVGDSNENRALALTHGDVQLFIPLQFFCCRNNGLALPLIALQYHDVRVNFEFADQADVTNFRGTKPLINMTNVELLVDTHFLDTDERKRFAQSSHEYLIEQVQFTGNETVNTQNIQSDLHFNHPCKALFWTLSRSEHSATTYLAYHPNPEKMAELNTKWAIANHNVTRSGYISTINASASTANGILQPANGTVTAADKLLIKPNGIVRATVNGVATEMVYVANEIQSAPAVAISAGDFDPEDFVLTGPVAPIKTAAETVKKHAAPTFANKYLIEVNAAGGGTNLAGGLGQNATWDNYNVTLNLHDNYSGNIEKTAPTLTTVDLQLNGHDRFKQQTGEYFVNVQSNEHWPHSADMGIHSYSFALNPAEHQPSGTCNMSRIDNARLVLDVDDNAKVSSTLRVYATNYNVLRVMSGMGGIAYSN